MTGFNLREKIREFAREYPEWYEGLTDRANQDVWYIETDKFKDFIVDPQNLPLILAHTIIALRHLDANKYTTLDENQRSLLNYSLTILEYFVNTLIDNHFPQKMPDYYQSFKNELIEYLTPEAATWAKVRVLFMKEEANSPDLSVYAYPHLRSEM